MRTCHSPLAVASFQEIAAEIGCIPRAARWVCERALRKLARFEVIGAAHRAAIEQDRAVTWGQRVRWFGENE